MRDNGRIWEAQLRRDDASSYKRVRMTQSSLDALLSQVLLFLRTAGDGVVGRPPTIDPHIRLQVVLSWLGQRGSHFTAF